MGAMGEGIVWRDGRYALSTSGLLGQDVLTLGDILQNCSNMMDRVVREFQI